MNLLGKIRRLYFRDGLSISDIECRTGITRKTIRKWLKAPEGVEPSYRRRSGDTKIAPYAERLTKMLEVDARRTPRERRTALKLFVTLQSEGFEGVDARIVLRIMRSLYYLVNLEYKNNKAQL